MNYSLDNDTIVSRFISGEDPKEMACELFWDTKGLCTKQFTTNGQFPSREDCWKHLDKRTGVFGNVLGFV